MASKTLVNIPNVIDPLNKIIIQSRRQKLQYLPENCKLWHVCYFFLAIHVINLLPLCLQSCYIPWLAHDS